MSTREFEVLETRHVITLTERGSTRAFRIPSSDAMLVGGLAGPTWRTGDVVTLSEEQQQALIEIDARCREMGDESAIRQNKLQSKLGCLSWIVLLVLVAALIVWLCKR